jgi:hypothetical protein
MRLPNTQISPVLLVLLSVHSMPSGKVNTAHCHAALLPPLLLLPPCATQTPAAGLRSMLEARSYKKELVLVVSNAAFVAVNLQPYLHMKRLGMAHLALMGEDEEQCKQVGEPAACCEAQAT